ncbi:PREDICTED: homocysteine S-methyltransferase YbgG-like [Dinoponera quadriceps]|uniref:Homocysteine S-methyltransferase YbgG-like n=1 Tax=Dinoponera quadriceps TaxID=609295 RepID=A0A6P3WXT3_DINQU|nr:PREDICTED: homocysteine S-methyltransferase YbgG-like [Dinoponera quadriceps]
MTTMKHTKVLDGGFSGQLSRHVGTKYDDDPLWTARFLQTNPSAVYSTHLDYLRAGAEVIETNTYQASVPGLMKYLNISMDESLALLAKAVELAKQAVDVYMKERTNQGELVIGRKPLVAGSCGPYGACLHDKSEYTGAYGKSVSRQELMDWHRPRVRALLDAGVDLLALETVPCVEEADALVELLREFPRARAWLSFSCRDERRIADGSDFQEVAVRCYRALPEQIVAVGVNCVPPGYVKSLLEGVNTGGSRGGFVPLVVYPNRGGSYSETDGWIPVPDDQRINLPALEWLDLGVRFIGGCCKVFAEDIAAIRSLVDRRRLAE